MDEEADLPPPAAAATPKPKQRPEWLFWALSSGAFAACNGVFAKLTTAGRTHELASFLAKTLTGSLDNEPVFEVAARAVFFGLNILSNAIMWFLFTRALTAATSTTRVSILNTSANFLVTAVLGMFIFGEELPLGWWLGASMLVAGSVIIGAREGKETEAAAEAATDANDENIPRDSPAGRAGAGRIRLGSDSPLGPSGRSRTDQVEPYRDQPINAAATEEPVELRR